MDDQSLSQNDLCDLELFHDGVNYTTREGAAFENLESAIVEGLFGFCGCGQPEKFLSLVGNAMRVMIDFRSYCDGFDDATKDPGWEAAWKKKNSDLELLCGGAGGVMLLQYVLDKAGLTEHGGSVCSAWPSPKGYAMMAAIDLLEEEA